MPDKRAINRHKKRLTLKFGIEAPNKLAFTEDISAHGLFIKTVNILPLGSRVKVELTLSEASIWWRGRRVLILPWNSVSETCRARSLMRSDVLVAQRVWASRETREWRN